MFWNSWDSVILTLAEFTPYRRKALDIWIHHAIRLYVCVQPRTLKNVWTTWLYLTKPAADVLSLSPTIGLTFIHAVISCRTLEYVKRNRQWLQLLLRPEMVNGSNEQNATFFLQCSPRSNFRSFENSFGLEKCNCAQIIWLILISKKGKATWYW